MLRQTRDIYETPAYYKFTKAENGDNRLIGVWGRAMRIASQWKNTFAEAGIEADFRLSQEIHCLDWPEGEEPPPSDHTFKMEFPIAKGKDILRYGSLGAGVVSRSDAIRLLTEWEEARVAEGYQTEIPQEATLPKPQEVAALPKQFKAFFAPPPAELPHGYAM